MMHNSILNYVLLNILRIIYRLWKKNNPVASNPRLWASNELGKFSQLFHGEVVNVSAGKDNDKSRKVYRDYFQKASSYTITNYFPEFVGSSDYKEVQLDLSERIDGDNFLKKKFDVVLNFTVLEHIFDVHRAVKNLCQLSSDIVITVVPFVQELHQIPEKYKDYWRISPYSLARLFNHEGFQTMYISWNSDPLGNIYIFHIASCKPEKWRTKIVPSRPLYGPGAERLKIKPNSKNSFNATEIDFGLIYQESPQN